MEKVTNIKNMSDDELKKQIFSLLEKEASDEKKIILLNNYLSKTFDLNRKQLSVFLIEKLDKFRKANRYKYLEKELTSGQYKFLSFKKKVEYWSGKLHGQMRNQVEACLDEYSIYTPEWYITVKKYEPKFDDIMDIVFREKWGDYWDKNEYLKRIRE